MRRFLSCLFLSACSAAEPSPASRPAEPGSAAVAEPGRAPQPQAAPAPDIAPSAESVKEPSAGTAPHGGEERRATATAFPPQDLEPPHARSAQPGDGRWVALAKAGDRAAEGPPALVKTVIHPHEASRFIELTIVAIDLGAVSLHFMPGKEDVGKTKVPFEPGLVPQEQRDGLLAIFNGGFQPRHGRWGMKLGETTVLPPREPGCTVALYQDGSVRLRTWPALAPTAASLHALRQTPPCLVEQGEIHPDLLAGRDAAWKGKTPGIVTRRRSAIGLDRSGTVLFYALAIEAPPRLIAEGLRHAGAHDAAELDINWNWTRFLLFGKDSSGALRVSSSLAPGEYAKSGWVERASERDFFYLVRRSAP